MNLGKYPLEDLFLSAIKAETDSREAYSIMAGITKNAFLKNRLMFLSDEEEKHRLTLEAEFMLRFRDKEIVLPDISPVPLPEIDIRSGNVPLSELFRQAMDAEKAARDFYLSFAKFAKDEQQLAIILRYFSKMEEGHYEILKREKASAEEFEAFDDFHPGMHLGP